MIDSAAATELLAALCRAAGVATPVRRRVLTANHLSAVERVWPPDGVSLVFKYALAPFTAEDRVLTAVAAAGVRVPTLLAAHHHREALGLLLADLGEAVRGAGAADAAAVAVAVHQVPPIPTLCTWTKEELSELPARCLEHLHGLRRDSRWPMTTDLDPHLRALDAVARPRSQGSDTPPFGTCHGELHPTSIHVGATATTILDLATAFTGPGLWDLAHWQGTRQLPNPAALRDLVNAYVTAGGDPHARTPRGGLDAAIWALGWHRVHAAHFVLHHAGAGDLHPGDDHVHTQVVRRQLAAAADLLT